MSVFTFFPHPYEHELFYSVLARYKVRCNVLSDKNLLTEVFESTTVVATPEIPNGIDKALENVGSIIKMSGSAILQNHTLFPLYTGLSVSVIREKIKHQMLGLGINTYTTSTGLATSTLNKLEVFRYCSVCVVQQLETVGEVYWDRRWFGYFTRCCPVHGAKFVRINHDIHDFSRHMFYPAIMEVNQTLPKRFTKASWQDTLISQCAEKMLAEPIGDAPTYYGLTQFYKNLALDFNFNRGSVLRPQEIIAFIKNFWSWKWLSQIGFTDDSFEYAVLSLFRKQRKQQVYPVHIIAALPFFRGSVDCWWSGMSLLSKTKPIKESTKEEPESNNKSKKRTAEVELKKKKWLELVQEMGPKKARYSEPDGQKIYAAIYRSDREWLSQVNMQYKSQRLVPSQRIDWHLRDIKTCRSLFKILYSNENLNSERQSKRWFLLQLSHAATIETNLYRLPLCKMFLDRYSESVDDYQCRRLTLEASNFRKKSIKAKSWMLLRTAGINTQRNISSRVFKVSEWCIEWLRENIK